MTDSYITNNHLKDVVDELKRYLDEEKDAPVELIAKFICELKVSNLQSRSKTHSPLSTSLLKRTDQHTYHYLQTLKNIKSTPLKTQSSVLSHSILTFTQI